MSRKILIGLAVLAVVALVVWGGQQLTPYVEQFRDWVDQQGAWGPLLFILGYAVATVCFIPGSALTIGAGVIFGLLWGTVYVFVGASLGAVAAFLIARYLARDWVEKKIAGDRKFSAVDKAVEREGGKIVALLRLSPVIPFVILNYALGLTGVRFWPFALACFAMLPGTFLYVYLGHIGAAATTEGGGKSVWEWVALGVGLVVTVIVTWLITKKAKAALDEQGGFEAENREETSHD